MYCYNVLLYLRCLAETAKINLMVFLFTLYCVVEPKYTFSQERLCNWRHFESEGFWNSEVAYWVAENVSKG